MKYPGKLTVAPMSLAICLALALTLPALAGEKAPSTAEQMAGLEAMCTASADARAARHMDKPLYERLGGYDRILELTTEIVRLHSVNPEIKHTLDGVDHEMLARHVADFMAAGTGGTASYTGRALPAAHKHLNLTDAHFLSAGGDIVKAMQSMDYGQEEIDEVVCILVSLKDQVVFK
jgi:hemoglobin